MGEHPPDATEANIKKKIVTILDLFCNSDLTDLPPKHLIGILRDRFLLALLFFLYGIPNLWKLSIVEKTFLK